MDPAVPTYLAYLGISVGLTVWVAQTLSRHGRVFLVDVFDGDARVANALNHLLVVGFYLVNLGFVTLTLRTSGDIPAAKDALELLSVKVGTVLLVLGAAHFLNLYILSRIRRRIRRRYDLPATPPIAPDMWAPTEPAR